MSKSAGEEELAFQLSALKIVYQREWRFDPVRRWRFDFALIDSARDLHPKLAVEIEGGSFNGGHRRGREANKDTEKHNAAVLNGWSILRFTPYQVETGEAISTIAAALGRPL